GSGTASALRDGPHFVCVTTIQHPPPVRCNDPVNANDPDRWWSGSLLWWSRRSAVAGVALSTRTATGDVRLHVCDIRRFDPALVDDLAAVGRDVVVSICGVREIQRERCGGADNPGQRGGLSGGHGSVPFSGWCETTLYS